MPCSDCSALHEKNPNLYKKIQNIKKHFKRTKTTTKQKYKNATSLFKEKANRKKKQLQQQIEAAESHNNTISIKNTKYKHDSTESNEKKRIPLLKARIRQLEQKVKLLESSLIVTKNTNSTLDFSFDVPGNFVGFVGLLFYHHITCDTTGKVAQEIGEKLGLDSAFRFLPWMLESKFKVCKR